MKSLHAKLSAALLLPIGLLGGAFFIVERNSTRLYYEELSQRLNSPIAVYVAGEQQLIANGVPNAAALETLAHQAMIVNPTVEIYLLDRDGRILGHALPADELALDRVDLAPLLGVLDGTATLPAHGEDPRRPGAKKVFSVAEVRDGDELQGYVYAVLGGAQYETLAADISGGYVTKTSGLAIAALGLLAFVAGACLFAFLTRRLRCLTREVRDFTESGFDPAKALDRPDASCDEIDTLGSAFSRMSSQIVEQFEQLRESDRLRRELITNVSHDLRTPLASMQGYLESLIIKGEELSPEERRAYLQVARKHTLRLAQLISELFELSKLESGSVVPAFESFSLAELMQDLVQEFELEARDKDVRIAVERPARPLSVVADISLIQRVLENLIKNALRFTPAGGEIRLRLSRHSHSVGISVADTGAGIPEAHLPRIFDRFYRAEAGDEAQSNSSGLGLSIVKRILDLHGSRITVSSKLQSGTRFDFELPTERLAA